MVLFDAVLAALLLLLISRLVVVAPLSLLPMLYDVHKNNDMFVKLHTLLQYFTSGGPRLTQEECTLCRGFYCLISFTTAVIFSA